MGKVHDLDSGNVPKPSPTEHVVQRLRTVISRYLPGKRIEMIDEGNDGGIGIKVTYDDPAKQPSEEVKQILKDENGRNTCFTYQSVTKQWRKLIGSGTEPEAAEAIRFDAERRFEAICEQMVHEERLKKKLDEGSGAGHPPIR